MSHGIGSTIRRRRNRIAGGQGEKSLSPAPLLCPDSRIIYHDTLRPIHPIHPMHSLHHRRERANARRLPSPPLSSSVLLPLRWDPAAASVSLSDFRADPSTKCSFALQTRPIPDIMMQLLPSHKETKYQRKSDLFRPWDAAAAAAQQAKLPRETKTSEHSDKQTKYQSPATSIKSSHKKCRDKHRPPSGPGVTGDNIFQTNAPTICSPPCPIPAPSLNQNHMSLRIPFQGQPFQRPLDPFTVPNGLLSCPEQRFMSDMYASQLDGAFLEAAASSVMMSRSWKLHQKKQRPKRFQCPHCQVSFSNNGQLRGHVRIHTGT